MSRSGYSDDPENLALYRAAVERAARGKRGQAMFREMLEALDAMPERGLLMSVLVAPEGVCALGCLGQARGIDMTGLDPGEWEDVARAFDIADSLAREVVFENDEAYYRGEETPEARWERVRKWVVSNILDAPQAAAS